MRLKHIAVLLLLTVITLPGGCGREQTPEAKRTATPVTVAEAVLDSIALPIHASGILQARQSMRLAFKTGGVIEKIFVREGAPVGKGAVLAQLELDEIEANVEQARNGFDKALRDYERVKKLYDEGAATLEQMQNVETLRNVARSKLYIAEYNLAYSTIKAPAQGYILKQLAEEHEIVGPGQPVFYFGAGGRQWIVRAGLSDREIVNVEINDRALVTFDAHPGIEFPARVIEIAKAADPQTGAFDIELLLDDKGERLAAGFVAHVQVLPSAPGRKLLIPVSALIEADGDYGAVFVIEADTARRVDIGVGEIVGNELVVRSGLSDGDQLAVDGAAYLKTGDSVKIVTAYNDEQRD